MSTNIRSVRDLRVYQDAANGAAEIFELTKSFPREELYSLVQQFRDSSRSVGANIAEAWRKRSYPAAFVSKLRDAEGEAEETRFWIETSARCGYLELSAAERLDKIYNGILAQLVRMAARPDQWTIRAKTLSHQSPRPRVTASPRHGTPPRPRVTASPRPVKPPRPRVTASPRHKD